jgi:cell division septum initiation protein DivIVA
MHKVRAYLLAFLAPSMMKASRGILKCMDELLNLKEDEKHLIISRIHERRDVIRKVDAYAAKQKGLEKTISEIRNDRDGQRHIELKRESHDLEHEIQELEMKLAEKRNRYRHVKDQITQIENSLEARLSSYQASQSLHESEIRRFLEQPPLEPLKLTTEKSPFHSLNPKTRTLEMARDHWRSEQHILRKRQRAVHAEISALEEGGRIWQSVVIELSNFERKLRNEMQRNLAMSSMENPSATSEKAERGRVPDEVASKLITSVETISQNLEENLDMAEERHWKLLVCCIGAELEAIKEAHIMLVDMFNLSYPEREAGNFAIYLGKEDTAKSGNELEETHGQGLLISTHPDDPIPSPRGVTTRSEDEDDEPDPAWLLSDS